MIFNSTIRVMLALNLMLVSTLSFSSSNVNSNIKPIPKNFIGKWAGMHSTKKKLTKSILNDLCENGGEQDTSFFVDFNPDGQRLTSVSWWEDVDTEYPVSYSKYTANHILGQSLSMSFEMGEEDTLASKTFSSFEYKISNGKLYVGSGANVIEMMRCD